MLRGLGRSDARYRRGQARPEGVAADPGVGSCSGKRRRGRRRYSRKVVAECCEELGEAMRGIDVAKLDPKELLQTRGW